MHLQMVREEERKKIARELHDEMGQMLTLLKINLNWMKRQLRKTQKLLTAKVEDMLQVVDSTTSIAQRIISELRPELLTEIGLKTEIE